MTGQGNTNIVASSSTATKTAGITINPKPQKNRRGGRGKPNPRDSPEIQLSKLLSYILRHGAEKHELKLNDDGSVEVDELLKLPKFKNVTLDQIKHVVDTNEKKRFSLEERVIDDRLSKQGKGLFIRANQGHSIKVKSLPLVPITDPEQFAKIVHGTNHKAWESIKTQGLSRMSRNHIHFAPGKLGEDNVISGMRKNCQVFIYIDIKQALQDGIEFFVSDNNVILSPGITPTNNNTGSGCQKNEGIIGTKYFKLVEDDKGNKLWPQ